MATCLHVGHIAPATSETAMHLSLGFPPPCCRCHEASTHLLSLEGPRLPGEQHMGELLPIPCIWGCPWTPLWLLPEQEQGSWLCCLLPTPPSAAALQEGQEGQV